jgi:hypothetical protein
MIYGNNVEAKLEYFQRRMVEKALDALQAKHDELAELVECYLACDSAYSGMRRDNQRGYHVLYYSYHFNSTITGLGYRILMETRLRLLAALRKAVERGLLGHSD